MVPKLQGWALRAPREGWAKGPSEGPKPKLPGKRTWAFSHPSLGALRAQPCNFGTVSWILEIQKAKLVRIENPTPLRRRATRKTSYESHYKF